MKALVVGFIFAVTSFVANAATITLNKGLSPGFNIQDASGASSSGFIFIGTFAGGTAPGTPAGGDYSSVISSFRTFGSVAAPAAGTAISGSVTSSPATPANFNTLQMYMIVANNSVLGSATQFGLFTNTPSTFFPADTTAAGSFNFNVNVFSALGVVAGAGSLIDNATGADTLRLVNVAAIPEPSVALLGALGLIGLVRRRR